MKAAQSVKASPFALVVMEAEPISLALCAVALFVPVFAVVERPEDVAECPVGPRACPACVPLCPQTEMHAKIDTGIDHIVCRVREPAIIPTWRVQRNRFATHWPTF